MSFSLTVPKSESLDEFYANLDAAKASPKADGRTKAGKYQKEFVHGAKYALDTLSDQIYEGLPLSATASGHTNADGTGFVSVTLNVLAPTPDEA